MAPCTLGTIQCYHTSCTGVCADRHPFITSTSSGHLRLMRCVPCLSGVRVKGKGFALCQPTLDLCDRWSSSRTREWIPSVNQQQPPGGGVAKITRQIIIDLICRWNDDTVGHIREQAPYITHPPPAELVMRSPLAKKTPDERSNAGACSPQQCEAMHHF